MKICIVAYKFGTEQEIGEHLGTYHYFIETLRRMADTGHEVFVIAPWLSWAKKGSAAVGKVKVLRYFPPLFNRPKLSFVNSLLRSWYINATSRIVLKFDKTEKPEVICVWQARETGYAVARVADKLKAPFVFRQITAWQWHFERSDLPDAAIQEKFAREIYKKAKSIIFVTQAAAEAEKSLGLPDEKIRAMGVAIETDVFKPAGEPKSGNQILFIGRINYREKGIGYLLDAMPLILKEIPGARLTVVGGEGEWDRMIKQIADLKIENDVELAGKQPFDKLPEYLNAADVMAVPSVWLEAFGQVTIEAMSCGVPVVTSDMGGSTEINVDGETGLIVPKANSQALAEAVIKILKDAELRKRLGTAARKRAEENYSYEVLVKNFLDLLGEAKH